MVINPNNIKTKNDLIKFVKGLANEAASNSNNWENEKLPFFLEAMAAWIEDMDGYYKNQGEPIPIQPSWKTIGEILQAATMYE